MQLETFCRKLCYLQILVYLGVILITMLPFIFHPSLVLIIIDLTVVSRIGITVKMNFDYDESMDQICLYLSNETIHMKMLKNFKNELHDVPYYR